MIEVEIKLPVNNCSGTAEELERLGFAEGNLVEESDTYFNSEARDFKQTDEALRIRCCANRTTGKCTAVITYKGPKLDAVSMTRPELETGIEDAGTCQAILLSLGFRPCCPVRKLRQYYHRGTMTACVDQVENLGDFLELEILVASEEERELALGQIGEVLKHLGYRMADTTRTSYLSMLQAKEREIR